MFNKFFNRKSMNNHQKNDVPVNEAVKVRKIVETNILGGDQWLQLKEHVYDDGAKYTFSHELRCDGQIVAVLPYRFTDNGKLEYLFRHESTAIWSPNELILSTITGGVDPGMSVEATAIKELKEEAGYLVVETMLEPLGTCFGTKSTDTVYSLFAVNVGNAVKVPAKGQDAMEVESENCWYDAANLLALDIAKDPFVFVLFAKAAMLQMKKENNSVE